MKEKREKAIVSAFSLRPIDLYHLEKMSRVNDDNKSKTIQQAIDLLWQKKFTNETNETVKEIYSRRS